MFACTDFCQGLQVPLHTLYQLLTLDKFSKDECMYNDKNLENVHTYDALTQPCLLHIKPLVHR
jgi:hypothetical protein